MFSRSLAVARGKQLQVDAIAQHDDIVCFNPEGDQRVLESAADYHNAGGVVGSPFNLKSGYREPRNEIHVSTTRRNDNWLSKGFSKHRGGDTVRVKIMGIDQIEIPLTTQAAQYWQAGRKEQRRRE